MEATTLKRDARLAPAAADERTLTPIKWWAGIGAVVLAFAVYLVVAWIVSGDFKTTPTGPDPVPGWIHNIGIVTQVASVLITLSLLYRHILRPLRRDGRIGFDGLFILALGSMYWQDPIVNYTQAWCSFNADLVNFGSWSNHIPGWQSPNGEKFAEPLLFAGLGYMWVLFGGAVSACWAMGKAKARWPRLGKLGLVGICFVWLAGFDFLMEVCFMWIGLWTYGGSIPSLTVFHGHYYQFPIYEPIMWGGVWTLWTCVRYFRNDRGESIAERGVQRLRVTGAKRTFVRFLALVGLLNAITLVLYMLPWQIIATHSGPWVQDAQKRSYLMDQLCGPGTGRACADPDLPIQTRDSLRITPDRRLVP